MCPHKCRVNRLKGQTGRCGIADQPLLSAAEIHIGEEPPLVTGAGSGTVFMAGCIAQCCFCQNYQISRHKMGSPVSIEKLAQEFLLLQGKGCSNLNWVTPTPHLPFLLKALALAIDLGFKLPVVYNCNGYMNLDILLDLEGIVDIYLPDMKYGEDIWADEFSGLPDYTKNNTAVIREMYRQVGILRKNSVGGAVSGLMVRHLVLPEKVAGTEKVIRTIAKIDPNISICLMAQYKPCFEALNHPILGRPLFKEEFEDACELLELYRLTNAYIQSSEALRNNDDFFPDFNKNTGDVFRQNRL
ncbi:radical SAM protein [bacterium]|nr:radical SAM protein [bacterium]